MLARDPDVLTSISICRRSRQWGNPASPLHGIPCGLDHDCIARHLMVHAQRVEVLRVGRSQSCRHAVDVEYGTNVS
jgi:hypothetical protein